MDGDWTTGCESSLAEIANAGVIDFVKQPGFIGGVAAFVFFLSLFPAYSHSGLVALMILIGLIIFFVRRRFSKRAAKAGANAYKALPVELHPYVNPNAPRDGWEGEGAVRTIQVGLRSQEMIRVKHLLINHLGGETVRSSLPLSLPLSLSFSSFVC